MFAGPAHQFPQLWVVAMGPVQKNKKNDRGHVRRLVCCGNYDWQHWLAVRRCHWKVRNLLSMGCYHSFPFEERNPLASNFSYFWLAWHQVLGGIRHLYAFAVSGMRTLSWYFHMYQDSYRVEINAHFCTNNLEKADAHTRNHDREPVFLDLIVKATSDKEGWQNGIKWILNTITNVSI